jgi:hypothetical protein
MRLLMFHFTIRRNYRQGQPVYQVPAISGEHPA